MTSVSSSRYGSDPLPFKLLSAEPELCQRTKFVDVDYQKLLENKYRIISETDALHKYCDNIVENVADAGVLLASDHYCAVAADLSSPTDLARLTHLLEAGSRPVLFLAEVSMTYMEPEMAAKVIHWGNTFPNCMPTVLVFVNLPL